MNAITNPPAAQDPVQAAIAAAQAAAAAVATQAQTTQPAIVPQQQTGVGMVAGPARRISMSDVVGQGLSVDEWLNVGFHGLTIGKPPQLLTSDPIVVIDLDTVIANLTIKYGQNPVQYRKTYDRVNDSRGGSWADTVAMAQRIDNKAREYRSADLPMVLLEDATYKGGSFKAGTKLGYSISTTGFSEWENALMLAQKAGFAALKMDGNFTGLLKVKLGHKAMSRNNNQWGIVTYEVVGAFEGEIPSKAA